MGNLREILRYLLVGVAVFSVVGCTVRPNVLSAHIKDGDGETKIVEVTFSADDAKEIENQQIYFWIVVVDCNNYENRFPIKPYIDGEPASNFRFSTSGGVVAAQGTMPGKVFVDFPKACVALEGGSYIFGKLKSTTVPLVWVPRQGKL